MVKPKGDRVSAARSRFRATHWRAASLSAFWQSIHSLDDMFQTSRLNEPLSFMSEIAKIQHRDLRLRIELRGFFASVLQADAEARLTCLLACNWAKSALRADGLVLSPTTEPHYPKPLEGCAT